MCVGLSAKVVKISNGTAVVDAGGAKREISAQLLEDLEPGDYVDVYKRQVLNSQVAAGTGWNIWYAQSNRNKGFPILYTSATVQNQVQDAARGITVTGRMHGAKMCIRDSS